MLKAQFPAAYQLFDLGQVILYLKVNFSSIKWDLYMPDTGVCENSNKITCEKAFCKFLNV